MKLQQIKILAAGLIVVFPILLVLDVIGYRMIRRTERSLGVEGRASEVLRADERAATGLTLSEFAARQALAYRDAAALDTYRTARESALRPRNWHVSACHPANRPSRSPPTPCSRCTPPPPNGRRKS